MITKFSTRMGFLSAQSVLTNHCSSLSTTFLPTNTPNCYPNSHTVSGLHILLSGMHVVDSPAWKNFHTDKHLPHISALSQKNQIAKKHLSPSLSNSSLVGYSLHFRPHSRTRHPRPISGTRGQGGSGVSTWNTFHGNEKRCQHTLIHFMYTQLFRQIKRVQQKIPKKSKWRHTRGGKMRRRFQISTQFRQHFFNEFFSLFFFFFLDTHLWHCRESWLLPPPSRDTLASKRQGAY